jgi:hypothetical protein
LIVSDIGNLVRRKHQPLGRSPDATKDKGDRLAAIGLKEVVN